jgi:hypothetical protein
VRSTNGARYEPRPAAFSKDRANVACRRIAPTFRDIEQQPNRIAARGTSKRPLRNRGAVTSGD